MRALVSGLLLGSLGVMGPAFSQDSPPANPQVASLVETFGDAVCAGLELLPQESCKEVLTAATSSSANGAFDAAALADKLKQPEILNSALSKAFGGSVPLGLEFKVFDSGDGESSLGVAYDVQYDFLDASYGEGGKWNKRVAVEFDATGNVAFERTANPRDFLDTTLNLSASWSTALPQQDLAFGAKLTQLAVDTAICSDQEIETEQCRKTRQDAFAMFDQATRFLKGFQRYEFGFEGGIESDQEFDATQSKVGTFAFAQYDAWRRDSLLGTLKLFPAVRVSVDYVTPDDETPRALAGDDSSFYRFAGEVSLWRLLSELAGTPVVLTANYRYYAEIGASDLVRDAGLDDYGLVTVSLSGTNGVFVSYSSGELPLDTDHDNVVEIGWKVNF
ncbi:MAG: hypothetical protein OEN55_03725 [Alphaproteobacteria bacterium]|nr:hypothetical protein [Alphaproteobacteria bacterium]